jgi:membrane-associated PAP2 superfamily phosphatase
MKHGGRGFNYRWWLLAPAITVLALALLLWALAPDQPLHRFIYDPF